MPITLKETIRIKIGEISIKNNTKKEKDDKKIQNITTQIKTQSKKVLR